MAGPTTKEAATAEASPSSVVRQARQRIPFSEMAERGRLRLQRRARRNFREHVRRAAIRFAVLLGADLAAVWLVRAAARFLNEPGLVGSTIARFAAEWLPVKYMEGWSFAVAVVLSMLVMGTYGQGDLRRDPRRILLSCGLATALVLWSEIWQHGVPRIALQYALLTMWLGIMLVISRLLIDRIVMLVFPERRITARTLLIGTAEECTRLAGAPMLREGGEFQVVGFLDTGAVPAAQSLGGLPVLDRVLHDERIEAVIVSNSVEDERFADIADVVISAGCQLLSVPRELELPGVRPQVVVRQGTALLQLTAPAAVGWQLALKRGLDIMAAAAGLVLAAPLLALIAAAIRLDSRGPVFFTQVRVGQGGRRFRIVKFRTMVCGAEDMREKLVEQSVYRDERLFKVPDDPRITRVGRLLRRTSLDELPQLWNVLRGEMSLVGPRPPLPSEVELYEDHHFARFEVRPGITGPWQVAGRNEITDFEEVVALESAYIRDWSLLSDLVLIVRTIPAVLRMHGAY